MTETLTGVEKVIGFKIKKGEAISTGTGTVIPDETFDRWADHSTSGKVDTEAQKMAFTLDALVPGGMLDSCTELQGQSVLQLAENQPEVAMRIIQDAKGQGVFDFS